MNRVLEDIDFIFYTIESLDIYLVDELFITREKKLVKVLKLLKKNIIIREKINKIFYGVDKEDLNYFLEKFNFIYCKNNKDKIVKKNYLNAIGISLLCSIKEYTIFEKYESVSKG